MPGKLGLGLGDNLMSSTTAVVIEDYFWNIIIVDTKSSLEPLASGTVVDVHDTWDLDGVDYTPEASPDDEGYWSDLDVEEVNDGDGSSTATWSVAYSNTTLSTSGSSLRGTANGSGAYGFSQELTGLDTSSQYVIEATINVDNASSGAANFRLATNSNLSSNVVTLSTTTGATTTILSPSASTMYIGIVDTASGSSNYVEFDNISVKEYAIQPLDV